MSKTWRTTSEEDYYYEAGVFEAVEAAIEKAHNSAYERAYQAQCQRELALWERRNNSGQGITPS